MIEKENKLDEILDIIADLSMKEISIYSKVGISTECIHDYDAGADRIQITYREKTFYVDRKYLRKYKERLYLSQVYLLAKQGKNPADLFVKKPRSQHD
jgi:hypothetical protein